MSAPERFTSKIDRWLVAMVAAPVVLAGVLVAGRGDLGLPGDVLFVALAALSLWPFWSTEYIVDDEALRVRCAFLRRTVPLTTITALRPSRSPLSAPALSLDRIEIQHAAGALLVSPRDKTGFVNALRSRAPGVVVDGLAGEPARSDGASLVPGGALTRVLPFVALIQVAVLIVVTVTFYAVKRPPTIRFDRDRIVVNGMASAQIARADITDVSLEPALPRTRRTGGFGGLGSLRGNVRVDGLGAGKAFIEQGKPPYILMRTRGGFTLLNFDDPARTREVYDEIIRYWRGE